MDRNERLAREAVIIAKTGAMNLLDVLRDADKKVEKHDHDEVATATALVKASQLASELIQLLQRKGWDK